MSFHASIEGAQHGKKGLEAFIAFAKKAGATGCQPSIGMLENGKGGFKTVTEVRDALEAAGLVLDGVSMHCPIWIHGTAWTGSKTMRPFLPVDVARKSVEEIEKWAEGYTLSALDLLAELGVNIAAMFWGVLYGWEATTGYPWGFFNGGEEDLAYDLIAEGDERFLVKTAKMRAHANGLDIMLAHEIHPGTAAMCAADFLRLRKLCGDDKCVVVNADPSHCWEGESWQDRFKMVGEYIMACHIKNHVIRPGMPLRSLAAGWPDRPVQFTDLPSGQINLVRFVELLKYVGYHQRYCEITGRKSAPLITEAESAHRDLDATAENAIAYTRDHLCFPFATESFEKGMGAAKA